MNDKKWISDYVSPRGFQFIIEENDVHALLFVYEYAPECFAKDIQPHIVAQHHQRDYSQDDVAMAREFGLEEFGVPLVSWKLVE